MSVPAAGNPPASTDVVQVDVAAESKPSLTEPPPQIDSTSSIPSTNLPPSTAAEATAAAAAAAAAATTIITTATTSPPPPSPPPLPAASPTETSFTLPTKSTPTETSFSSPAGSTTTETSFLLPAGSTTTEASSPLSTNSISTQIPPSVLSSSSSSDLSPPPTATLPSNTPNSSSSSSLKTSPTENLGSALTSSLPAPPPPSRTSSGTGQITSATTGTSSKSSNTAPLIGGIVGSCCGLLIILVLAFLYIRWQKRNNRNGGGTVSGNMERYHQFDPDIGQTPRFARIRAAIDWKIDRALDFLYNAKQRVFPQNGSPNANMVGGTSQFPEWYQRSIGPPRRSGVAKTRIVDWRWGFGKRKKASVGVPGPEMRGVSAGPPVIPPFSPRSGINSTATVDFSQLLQMEEQERLIQQDRDRAEREHSRVPSRMDTFSGSLRQSYGSQSGLATPQRASVNPYSHRRSSTVGATSWYERPERERDKRIRSDPFDLEELKLGKIYELDGQPSILRQSDASNYSRRPGTAASGQSRESRTSRYSMGSYYQETQRESMSIDDRRRSMGSVQISPIPGVAL